MSYKPPKSAMTVAKLINALQKMPPDKLVEIATESDGDEIYIDGVRDEHTAVILNCIPE